MPTFTGARLPAAREQESGDRTCQHELRLHRHADAVTAAAAMEDLLPAHTEPWEQVLEVRHRSRGSAEHGGVERPAPRGEQAERDKTTTDLEAPVGNVLVWNAIARDVERGAEEQRERPRADEGSHRRTRGYVERDDHAPIIAYARRR
jgi:hypothetical protein